LDNLGKYASLNPLFGEAVSYLEGRELSALELGRIELKGEELFVSVAQTQPKSRAEAKLEAHRRYIDIQIPLSGDETMGYTPLAACRPSEALYQADKDIVFFEGPAQDYVTVKPGMFAIFFPQDGHAPGVTPTGVRKIIVKVKA
jgi:YhcH/YjgK/YiaL family protein